MTARIINLLRKVFPFSALQHIGDIVLNLLIVAGSYALFTLWIFLFGSE